MTQEIEAVGSIPRQSCFFLFPPTFSFSPLLLDLLCTVVVVVDGSWLLYGFDASSDTILLHALRSEFCDILFVWSTTAIDVAQDGSHMEVCYS
jgi:hypothetical protein